MESGSPAVINHHYGPSKFGDMLKSFGDIFSGSAYVGGMGNFGAAMKFLGEQGKIAQPMNLSRMEQCVGDIFNGKGILSRPHSNVLSISYPGR